MEARQDVEPPCRQMKSCSECRTTTTPLWRSGPNGPKSLCNACGIRHRKRSTSTPNIAGGGTAAPKFNVSGGRVLTETEPGTMTEKLERMQREKKLLILKRQSGEWRDAADREKKFTGDYFCSEVAGKEDVVDAALLLMSLSSRLFAH